MARRWKKDRRYYFDKTAADTAVAWIEGYCHHTEGEWYGRPFKLARWQKRIVRKLFGWKRPDGSRRFRRLWLEVARKNGKTEFAAALALYVFVGDGEMGGQVYSLATDKDQAKIVFNKAGAMVALSDDLRREIETLKTSHWCNALLASFKPLSSKPDSKHGFSPSASIGDEVHAWESGELFEVVVEGEGARRQPLNIQITTAGEHDESSYAWEQHGYALGILKGEIADEEWLVVIFAADEDDDWTDPEVWKKANPNLGISPKIEFLVAQCREARQLKRKENRFRQYFLNQWVGQATRWIPMEYWRVCTRAPDPRATKLFLSDPERDQKLVDRVQAAQGFDPLLWQKIGSEHRSRAAWGGLDLNSTTDLAALCWEFGPDENDVVPAIWRFWLPRDTLKAVAPRTRKLYEKFVDLGALVLTPGNVADYAFIEKQIMADSEEFAIAALGIDRWNATDLAVRLRENQSLPVELLGQGYATMSGPSKEFERRVLGLGVEHGNNPVMDWMANNVAVEQDAVENIKPTKERSGGKIDGIVAQIMARALAMSKPLKRSVYETRGVRTL